jgi:hypothetical protein
MKKKIFVLILALVLCLGFGVIANAQPLPCCEKPNLITTTPTGDSYTETHYHSFRCLEHLTFERCTYIENHVQYNAVCQNCGAHRTIWVIETVGHSNPCCDQYMPLDF